MSPIFNAASAAFFFARAPPSGEQRSLLFDSIQHGVAFSDER